MPKKFSVPASTALLANYIKSEKLKQQIQETAETADLREYHTKITVGAEHTPSLRLSTSRNGVGRDDCDGCGEEGAEECALCHSAMICESCAEEADWSSCNRGPVCQK